MEKVKGSTDKDITPGRPLFFAGGIDGRPATLVIHDDKYEPVFTQSEVKAMLIDIAKHSIIFVDTSEYYMHIGNVAEKHGVVFDPA